MSLDIRFSSFVRGADYSYESMTGLPSFVKLVNYEHTLFPKVENYIYTGRHITGAIDNGFTYQERYITLDLIIEKYSTYTLKETLRYFSQQYPNYSDVSKEVAIMFSDDQNYFYRARVYESSVVEYTLNSARLSITLILVSPFAHYKTWYTEDISATLATITNSGDVDVYPFITLTIDSTGGGVADPIIYNNDDINKYIGIEGSFGTTINQTIVFDNENKSITYLDESRLYLISQGSTFFNIGAGTTDEYKILPSSAYTSGSIGFYELYKV